jgi:TolA-binding protein
MRRLRSLFFVFWTAALPTLATDFEWSAPVQQAYAEAFRLRLDNTRRLTAAEAPRNGLALYVDDCADVLQLLLDEEAAQLEATLERNEARLDRVEDLDETSPWNRFVRAEIKLHGAMIKLRFGRETAAAWNVIAAYRLLEENARRFPNFLPNQKSLGLLHVLIGSTPESYQWVTRLLGLRGDVRQGLAELQRVAQRDPIFRDEAMLTSYVIQAYVLKFDANRLGPFEQFIRTHPDNALIQFMGHSIWMKLNRGEAALALLEQRPRGAGYLDSPLGEYHQASLRLEKGEYESAIAGYQAFLRRYRGVNFRKDATYKIYLAYALQNEDARGKPYLDQVRRVGKTYNEADQAAARAAEQPALTSSQKLLLKARLAFDGGFLSQALGYLQPVPESQFPQPRDRAELAYRRGRIYHSLGDTLRAVSFYERALALSTEPGWSFGANAALQLGYLHQARGQKAQAKGYFERALTFRRHEYKNSIDTKAKAALNELGY